ncbi:MULTISPECIES: 2-oxo acid dehydrogenase subunit E2 [unclassified Hyphomicrobium]|uniref:2-oxo acid dehydrogenase subunit E2 n=1 Tax=unclassified Hyphomicrobium TaxID=2619925 RepID=UPI000213D7E7|nr:MULTISPECIES: 2-oxo acid dehydrogenase subunit E2 [unclassified Hyphomicrobium]CCB63771.1 Dihydrolipoyllysine-residue acetyltransferase component of pyruvate dehydrogenase complex (E2) (Dihydrolipoamide acetyltransferase component of pyruvate dehydrogenase complex) [Hyphomicrobium sp. MC1]
MPLVDVKVPNIGDFENVPIIEIQVKPGDEVNADDPLITLESDKASMDVPSPVKGKVAEILVTIGDKVSEGSAILRLDTAGESKREPDANGKSREADAAPKSKAAENSSPAEPPEESELPPPADFDAVFASPSVRRIARELDVDLTKVKGTGNKGRITKEDVKAFIARSGTPAGSGAAMSGIPEIPPQDFAKYGPVETKPMSRLKRLTGPNLHRAWLNVPHVTNSDDADITDLEAYRKELDATAKTKGYRVTLVAFLLKASVSALKEYPEVNASLAPGKDALILKRYYNIGVAVDTPDGLVVPVIKDVDRKGILELSQELTAVSARMRDGKITPADIQGATFSISSLGGIGGTNFTPIVNAPEVAILGAVRAQMKPVWDGSTFQPRLMLPLCLSYDHRVVDGALAARFLRKICDALADVRQLVL